MNTLKINSFRLVTLLCIVSLTYSCSNDDDASGNALPTTLELLTSGTWYLESISYDNISTCEKETSFDFMADGSAVVNLAGEGVVLCVVIEVINTTYTLNESTINLNLIDDNIIGVVTYDASLQTLIITDNGGDFITLDKIKG
tara:strand:+ start:505 stop:933 length:429 start_codon:yes stop_codon:yes gene_type:complete